MTKDSDTSSSQPMEISPYLRSRANMAGEVDYGIVWFGVTVSGGLYAFVVFTLILGIEILRSAKFDLFPAELLTLAFFFLLFSIPFVVLGLICAGLASLCVVYLTMLFLWVMRLKPSQTIVGGFVGGATGFLCSFLLAGFLHDKDGEFWERVYEILIGPGLATVFGQIAGGRAAQKSSEKSLVVAKYALEQLGVVAPQARPAMRFQFDLRQLFVLTAWISVLLGLLHMAGILRPAFLIFILCWLLYQSVTLSVILRWVLPWWNSFRSNQKSERKSNHKSFT